MFIWLLETRNVSEVSGQILSSVLSLYILLAEIHNPVFEILDIQVSVSRRRLHFRDVILDHQKERVGGTVTNNMDQHVPRRSLPQSVR